MRTSYVKNGLIVGVIFLFVGVAVQPSVATVQPKEEIDNEHPLIQVSFMKPEDGIYCNNHKILPFFIPLVLCGKISIDYKVINGNGMERIEFYINNVLQESIPGSGPHYGWFLSWSSFSKITFGIKAYDDYGNHASDEITIWRIFR